MIQQQLTLNTKGKEIRNITDEVANVVKTAAHSQGLCHLFLQHTSASLILCENADPQVRRDLEHFFARLAPDGDPLFGHTQEGPDDMSAHVRTVLTQNSLTIPIHEGRLALGTWQGIFLWEHRLGDFQRQLWVSLV